MSAVDLLKSGKIWLALKEAVEFSLGVTAWGILGGFLIAAVYFSTESLKSTSFITFLLLLAASLMFDIRSIGLFFIIMLVFVSLSFYHTFLKK